MKKHYKPLCVLMSLVMLMSLFTGLETAFATDGGLELSPSEPETYEEPVSEEPDSDEYTSEEPSEAYLLCDVNGDGYATAADARIILRYAARIDVIDARYFHLADMNGDGAIKAADARLALRVAAQLEPDLEARDDVAPCHDIITTDRSSSDTKIKMISSYDAADQITVSVSAENTKGLESADLVFTYDAESLEFVNVKGKIEGYLTAGGVPVVGTVTFSFAYTEACSADSTDIAQITFKALKANNPDITCRMRSWDGCQVPDDAVCNETVKPCEHENTVPYDEIPVTCSNSGYTAGVYCNDCGWWISGHEVIQKLPHTDENGDGVCDICGKNMGPISIEYSTNNDILTATVYGENMQGTECFDLEFTYDASVLEYVSVERGKTAGYANDAGGKPDSGLVTFSATWLDNCYNDFIDICTITFKILSQENTQIGFKAKSWSGSETPSDTAFDIELEKSESEEPVPEEPMSEELTTEEPTVAEPASEEPESEEPASEEPVSQEMISEEPKSEEMTTEEPASQEPISAEPKSEEPTTEKITKVEPTTKEPVTVITVKDNGRVSADDEGKLVTVAMDGSKESLSASELLASIGNDNAKITDKDGKELESDALVGTGAKIQLLDNDGNVILEYEVIVPSDVNGDGKTTAADARSALRASAKLDNIAGVYSVAADMSGDEKITAADARKILRKSAGLEK